MNYICLICGYPNLSEQPFDGIKFCSTHEICPSCGFHYGYDDLNGTGEYPKNFNEWDIVKAYREKWIKSSPKWWSENNPSPRNWNPKKQLKNIGIDIDKLDWENLEPRFDSKGKFVGVKKVSKINTRKSK